MNVEFIDTNILVYAEDGGAGEKHRLAVDLLWQLATDGSGALSIQVLAEFYNTATKKLGMTSEETEETVRDLAGWRIHRSSHADVVRAIGLQRRFRLSWWDAMIVNSAIESGAHILWSEDLSHGQAFGGMTVRNPFV